MGKFQLYDNIKGKIKDVDLTNYQKGQFMKKINLVDDEGMDTIYEMIVYHYTSIGKNDKLNELMNWNSNAVKIDLDKLNISLKQILYKFIMMNIKKNRDDKKIRKYYKSPSKLKNNPNQDKNEVY